MSAAFFYLSLVAAGAAAWQAAEAWYGWRQRRVALARASAPWAPAAVGLSDVAQALGQRWESRWPEAAQSLRARLARIPGPPTDAGRWVLQCAAWSLLGLLVLSLLDLGAYAFLGLGFGLLPVIKLRDAELKRGFALRQALPDALDLLCACVQAGLGLDQALERCGQSLPAGAFREEWLRMLEQLRSGASRRQAFQAWEARCQNEDLGPVLRAILRSEQRGVALSPALLASSEQLRRLRSLRIQEQAAKAPIKMLLPLMLFFLPAVFLILFGPILMKLSETGF